MSPRSSQACRQSSARAAELERWPPAKRDERPLGVSDLARSEPHQDDKLDEVSVLRHGALGLSQCLHVKHVSILVLYVIQFLGLSSITLYQTFN